MKKYLIPIAIIVLSVACRKEIDIKVPDNERKIVLNTVVQPDSVFWVNIFRSNHVQDNSTKLLYLNNAKVDIFENGNLLETLQLDTMGHYIGSSAIAQIGHEYEIAVSVPNLNSVKSKITTMQAVSITSVDSIGPTSFDEHGSGDSGETLYRVNFKDIAGEDNYYRIKAASNSVSADTVYYNLPDSTQYDVYVNKLYFNSNDPSIEVSDHDDYYYLSDKLFNGSKYGFEIGVPDMSNKKDKKVYFYLEHISYDFYKYMISVDKQSETVDMELFFQSVQVFSNIEGGFGIVGTTTVSKDSINW